jgi:hypothetical protein
MALLTTFVPNSSFSLLPTKDGRFLRLEGWTRSDVEQLTRKIEIEKLDNASDALCGMFLPVAVMPGTSPAEQWIRAGFVVVGAVVALGALISARREDRAIGASLRR